MVPDLLGSLNLFLSLEEKDRCLTEQRNNGKMKFPYIPQIRWQNDTQIDNTEEAWRVSMVFALGPFNRGVKLGNSPLYDPGPLRE